MHFKKVLFLALEESLTVCSPVQNLSKDSFHDLAARDNSTIEYLDPCGKISRYIAGLDYCE